jgi:hypothetical protein
MNIPFGSKPMPPGKSGATNGARAPTDARAPLLSAAQARSEAQTPISWHLPGVTSRVPYAILICVTVTEFGTTVTEDLR